LDIVVVLLLQILKLSINLEMGQYKHKYSLLVDKLLQQFHTSKSPNQLSVDYIVSAKRHLDIVRIK